MDMREESSSGSSSSSNDPSDSTLASGLTTPSSDGMQDGLSKYGSQLPPVPEPEGGKLQPLALDAGTPDAWVGRDERMIRLTGKHPFNSEAPLTDLWKAGFLTPQSLFYVRSHGATPHVTERQAKEWTLRVHGLVEREVKLTIDDLKEKFQTVTLPITLVCAGNRRKEQNMVAKGLGFNWGAAGVSTGLFTGVYLADVLDYCKPIRPVGAFPFKSKTPGRARHVIFEGCDQLPKGKYGTSQRIQWARDRSKGMLLAWGLNGEALSPDHGYPLRLVVPGQIGGRMVKWLDRIEVSDEESQHYLHFMDNKVLPTQVTADQARQEMHWWYDEKYIINDLNVNAAVTVPAHDQLLHLDKEGPMTKVAGYAYTGGGKRVSRVEVTLDEGDSWQLAEIEYPEDKYRLDPISNHAFYGKLDLSETEMSFSWCFWELEVPTEALRGAGSLAVRATDEGLATMPRDMYWNAMSMMNNWWFRVAILEQDANTRRFEHPTQAGNTAGGWMQRLNDEGRDARYPTFTKESASTVTAVAPLKVKEDEDALMRDEAKMATIVTADEVQQHVNRKEAWFIVKGHVYDGTGFLEKHPGGGESITLVAGEDATEDFMAIHSRDAKVMLRDYHVGKLEEGAKLASQEINGEPSPANGPFLHPKTWKKSKLVGKTCISHNSRIFRFALEHEDQEVGLPIGQHVYVRCKGKDKDGNETDVVQRAYTPFSGNELKGYIDILIKVYFPCQEFPEGGKMTCALESLKVDEDSIELKGPLGHFIYEPGGVLNVHKLPRRITNVAMIAGGSGITPIWSTLKGILDDPAAQHINIWILDANRTEADILARAQLEEVIEAKPQVKLWHLLSSSDVASEWSMGRGRINLDCLRKHLPPPPVAEADDTIALLCGPPAMETVVLDQLTELGWDTERSVVRF